MNYFKLTNSSEHGWKVVQEYESHLLADDNEDEKIIARALIQAVRKVRQSSNRTFWFFSVFRYEPVFLFYRFRTFSAAVGQTNMDDL
jgi:hypothetical protein